MDPQLRYRFPGMDPWLEDRALWPGVHDSLIVDMARAITALVAPRYVARPGRRMVVEFPERHTVPDVAVLEHSKRTRSGSAEQSAADPPVTLLFNALEVKETFVEIHSLRPHRRVVTFVEVLSHGNKRPGADSRAKYLQKQEEVLASDVHLVELDLLRAGDPTVAVPADHLAALPRHDYRLVVRRGGARDRAEVYPVPLRQRLPRFPVPLLPPDPDAVIDLQRLLEHVYEAGAYAVELDYEQPPDPPLSEDDSSWARDLLGRPPAP